jgi:phospholipid/cholesterol/gamma-HCH transport system substrate-binding protein
MTGTRQLLLGAFFLTAFGLLATYSLVFFEYSWFGDKTTMRIEFPAANGLRVGDSVRVAGMGVGRVTRMSFDATAPPDRRIAVTISLDEPIVIREGYSVLIEETTLLGGRDIDIDMGPPDASPITIGPDTVLVGKLEAPPFEALSQVGDLVTENREAFRNIVANLDAVVAGVRAGEGTIGRLLSDEALGTRVGEAVDGFAVVMDDAKAITGDIRAGKGTLGKLFTEESLYAAAEALVDDMRDGMANLEVILADLEQGRGTLGRLFRDEGLADTVQAAIDDIKRIVEQASRGEGTLGRLLMKEEIADQIETILAKLNSSEGALGALITDEQMSADLRVALADIAEIVDTVKRGDGTVGKLIMSDEVYGEILAAVRLLTRSLEDYREAAPVSTFTSVLFGAF